MTYTINFITILFFKISNKLIKNNNLKVKLFSSKKILENNFRNKINFIQVGANDGVSFDFLFDFLNTRDSEGVVIEPIKEYFLELKKNYSQNNNIVKINKAIHNSEKKISIYKIDPNAVYKYPDWVRGIASLDQSHHKKLNIESKDIINEIVEADSFMNVMNQNLKNFDLDYLQIDTEGFDYEILKMINFSIIKPKLIKFESVNLSISDKQSANLLLVCNGYYLFDELGDTVAIDLKRIKLKL